MTTLSPKDMATAEKISAMEILWNDLCQHSLIESPDWHESVLLSRQQQRVAGNQTPIDWEKAKQQIYKQITPIKKELKTQ